MIRFTIFTLSQRRDFLPSVANSLAAARVPADVELRWTVRFNPAHRLPPEEHFRRLDAEIFAMENTWFFQLSDDNLLHPELITRWREILETRPEMRALHVRQQYGPTSFRPANPASLCGGQCDGGQVVFQSEFYKSFRWSYAQFRTPTSSWEGEVYRRMRERQPKAFVHHDELLAYHDRLRW